MLKLLFAVFFALLLAVWAVASVNILEELGYPNATVPYNRGDVLSIRCNETANQSDIVNVTIKFIDPEGGESYPYQAVNGTLGSADLWEFNWTIPSTWLLGTTSIICQGRNASNQVIFTDLQTIDVKNVDISLELSKGLLNPSEPLTVSGKAVLQPDGTNVSNRRVAIYVNESKIKESWNLSAQLGEGSFLNTTLSQAEVRLAQQELVVDGVSITLNGTHRYGVIRVINGGLINVTPYDGSPSSGWLELIAQQIYVDATSRIVADAAGYRGGVGGSDSAGQPGEGYGGGGGGAEGNNLGPGGGGGGAYGGAGGDGGHGYDSPAVGGVGGASYGDPLNESIFMGSGGGGGGGQNFEPVKTGGDGGRGGGAVILRATTIVIEGVISADGEAGRDGIDSGLQLHGGGGGGGSGGGILLEGDSIEVSGTISAKGGDGGNLGWYLEGGGGAGGGGRVKIFYDSSLSVTGHIVTDAGAPGISCTGGYCSSPEAGLAGTYNTIISAFTPYPFVYVSNGTYLSPVFDASSIVDWKRVVWYAAIPLDTSLSVEARVSNDSVTWSGWQIQINDSELSLGDGRYLQYRINMSTTNSSATPALRTILTSYQVKTDAWGSYEHTFAVPDEIGIYVLKVNITGPYGIRGENTTLFEIKSIPSENITINVTDEYDQTDRIVNPNETLLIESMAYRSDNLPLNQTTTSYAIFEVWNETDVLVNGSLSWTVDRWQGVATAPLSTANYSLCVRYEDVDGIKGARCTDLYVKIVKVSIEPIDPIVSSAQPTGIRGRAILIPDATAVAGENFTVEIDGVVYPNANQTDATGSYVFYFDAPTTLGDYEVRLNLTEPFGIKGKNATSLSVRTLIIDDWVISDEHGQTDAVVNIDELFNVSVSIREWNGSTYWDVGEGDFNLTINETQNITSMKWQTGARWKADGLQLSSLGNFTLIVNGSSGRGIDGQNGSSVYVTTLILSFVQPTLVHRGDVDVSIRLNVSAPPVANLTGVDLTVDLPSGWLLAPGNATTLSLGNLPLGTMATAEWFVNISAYAYLGDVNLNFSSVCAEGIQNETMATSQVRGWSAVNLTYPTATASRAQGIVNITCQVLDYLTYEGVPNYPIRFWIDGVNVFNATTNASGHAHYGWNVSDLALGDYQLNCTIESNVSLYYDVAIPNSARLVTLVGGLVVSLSKSEDEIYRNDTFQPYNVTLTTLVVDDVGNAISGAEVTLSIPDATFTDICLTDASGQCDIVYNPPVDITAGNYTIEITASKTGYTPGYAEDWILILGFLFPQILTPSEGAYLNRGVSYLLNVSIKDESGLPVAADVEWRLNGSLIASAQTVSWAVPTTQPLGNYILSANVSRFGYSPGWDAINLSVWGWSSVANITPVGIYLPGVLLEVKCAVIDANTQEGLDAYPVSFYKNESFVIQNSTSAGYAYWYWDTSGEYGSYEIVCQIADSGFYNKTEPYRAKALIRVENQLYLEYVSFTERVIFRRDADIPNHANLTFLITQSSTTGVPEPAANAEVWLSLPDTELSCLTNTTGACEIYYNPASTTEPANYTILINASKAGVNPLPQTEEWLAIQGILISTILQPPDGSRWHKTRLVPLELLVKDENGLGVTAQVKWYDETTLIATGASTSWTIPADYPLGWHTLRVNATKSWYTPTTKSVSLDVWGWAEPVISSPVAGDYNYDTLLTFTCRVTDSNTSLGIAGYEARLSANVTLLKQNVSDANGEVTTNWQVPQQLGPYALGCEIDHNATLRYNYSIAARQTLINAVDNIVPDLENATADPLDPVQGQTVNLTVDAYDVIGLDKVWARIEDPTGAVASFLASSLAGNTYNISYKVEYLGAHTVTWYANDTSANQAEALFTFTSQVGGEIVLDPESVNVPNITLYDNRSFSFLVTLRNIGTENMTAANISLEFWTPAYFDANSTFEPCGDILVGQNCTRAFEAIVLNGTPPMLTWLLGIGEWQRPDGSVVDTQAIMDVRILSNPRLEIDPEMFSASVPHGTEAQTGPFGLSSVGNDVVEDIGMSSAGGNLPPGWLEFLPSYIASIAAGESRTVWINVTVPQGQDPGLYDTSVWANTSNANNVSSTLMVEVPVDRSWDRIPSSWTKSIATNMTGQFGLLITNRGNVELSYALSKVGNASDYLTVPLSVDVPKQTTTAVAIEYGPIPAPGFYQATISATSLGASPEQLNTTVSLRVVDFKINLTEPLTTSPLVVNASDAIELHVDVWLAGTPLGENVTWRVFLNESLCPLLGVEYVGYWNLSCVAPSLPDARNYTLTVEAREVSFDVRVNDSEPSAIVYPDITPPLIHAVSVADTRVDEPVLIRVNASDNNLAGIARVLVEITYPNLFVAEYELVQVNGMWEYNFTYTQQEGDYGVLIKAIDPVGNVATNSTWFRVSIPILFSGLTLDAAGAPIRPEFVFFKPDTELSRYTVIPNASGYYNETLYAGIYDLKIRAFGNEIRLRRANFTLNVTDAFRFDDVPYTAVDIPLTRTRLKILAVEINISYEGAHLLLNYSQNLPLIVSSELDVTIYRCSNWTFSARSCAVKWQDVGGDVSTLYHTVNVSLGRLSAYAAVEETVCGNAWCEEEYGETCETCPEDCGPCPAVCGNGICEPGETCENCPADCGECPPPPTPVAPAPAIPRPVCGNGVCEAGETYETCPQDCVYPEAVRIVPESLEVRIFAGDVTLRRLSVENLLARRIKIDATVSAEIANFTTLSPTRLEVEAKKSEFLFVEIRIPPDVDPGAYLGYIDLSIDGLIKRVPLTILVVARVPRLIDLRLDILRPALEPNDTLVFDVTIYNLGIRERFDVNLSHLILDEKGQVLAERHEVVELITSLWLSRHFYLGELDLVPGVYYLSVRAVYDNQTTSVSDSFEVRMPWLTRAMLRLLIWCAMGGASVVAVWWARRWYIAWKVAKARYAFPIDFAKLPRKGAWLGKIAETPVNAYFNWIDLTTHLISAGATGSGKTVSAMVIAEEALKSKIPVIVFDPTAQWTGFVRACKSKRILKLYRRFGLRREDARAFRGMIYEITKPKPHLDFKKFLTPGEITIFCLNKLKPREFDVAIAHIIDLFFKQTWEESEELKALIIFDEVHRLLEKWGGKYGYKALERACREFRKWGLGLIMISQVLGDFKEAVKGNVLTELQMHTKGLEDLQRVATKYGEEFSRYVTKLMVGVGMLQNPKYNKGMPYFVAFRPPLHSPHKLPEAQIRLYLNFAARLEKLERVIRSLRRRGIDTTDLELEFKLAMDKLKVGQFRLVKIYVETLEKRLERYR